jgi:hypothetical protein
VAEGRRKARDPLLLLTLAGVAGAVLLFVYGLWGWGVALLLAAVLLLVARAEIGRRGEALTLAAVKARAAVVGRVLAVRSRGQMGIFRARREYADLEAERSRLFRDLGEAVYGGDDAAEKAARQALESVVRALGEKESEIEKLIAETEARVKRAQEPGEGGGGPSGPSE